MSFSEPGKFFDSHPGDSFQGRPGDAFQGRPGDSFQGGTFKARADERSAESHERHERWKQERAAKVADEAYEKAITNMANMAKNNAEGFASLAGQFRTMMELCYPDLVKLCNQQVRMDSSDLYPAVACLSGNGPVWRRSIPEGNNTGEALVWDDELAAWVPGEVAGAYAGEFALYLDGTTLKVKKGRVCINGWSVNFTNDISVGDVGNIGNSTVSVYLCAYQRADNAGNPVREERWGTPWRFTALVETSQTGNGVRGYIKLGEYSAAGGIKQEYLGGTGAQITVGLEMPSMDNMILKWNRQTETWQPGWMTAINPNPA